MMSEFRKKHREAFEKAISEHGAAAFFERFAVVQSKLKEELETEGPTAMRKYIEQPGRLSEYFDSMKSEEREKAMVDAMERAGIPPEVIYAFKKTRLVTVENNQPSKEDIAKWNVAIEEYKRQQPDQGGSK